MTRPVERKVYASTLGAGAGVTVSEFSLWVVDRIWWPADNVVVPLPVASFVGLVVTVAFTFFAGWLAKHDPGYSEIDQVEEVAEPLPDV